MAKPMAVRGTGLDMDKIRAMSRLLQGGQKGIVPAPMKWGGAKGKPHYIYPLRELFRRLGGHDGDAELLDPFMGAGTYGLNINPGGKSTLSDLDPNLVNALRAIQSGVALDWSPYKDDTGFITPQTFFEQIRGGTPRGRGGTHFENFWPPREGTLNDLLNRDDLTDAEQLQALKLWMMYQNLATGGFPRMAGGLANNTFNWTQPGHSIEDMWDYSHYQEPMENFDIRHMNALDFLQDPSIIDTERTQLLALDPPYLGEPGSYGGKNKGKKIEEGMDEETTRKLATLAGDLAASGMPIVAHNSAHAAPIFEDAGFDVHYNKRRDNFRSRSGSEMVDKPEMVATANTGMTEDDWFGDFPEHQWTHGDLEPRRITKKSQMTLDAFDLAWSLIR